MSSASSRKEPSMDEILASIRRIIESGDEPAGKKATSAEQLPETTLRGTSTDLVPTPLPRFEIHYVSPDDEHEDDASEDELRGIEAADFADEISDGRAADDASAQGEDAPGEAWTDEATEAHDLRFEREGNSAWEDEQAPAASAVPPAAGNENLLADEGDNHASPARQASPSGFAFEFDDDAFEAALRSDETLHEPAPRAADAGHQPPLAPPVKPPMPESVIEGASALLSAQAGDQVASAFDDLTRAIRDGQMRSMEEMAREMLRPMLQEWLDDNLPRIVERLVRDEIERIARGPRR